MWVHLLATKDQASAAIKKLQAAVELESRQKLKMLHTDRGGECTSKELGEYFSDQGVQRQLTVPYTPRQNGVVERRN
jgi:transposase InsO family protein